MYKISLLLIFSTTLNFSAEKKLDINDIHPYYPLNERTLEYKYFESSHSMTVKFLKEKTILNEEHYTVKETKYSWGKTKSSYCRLLDGEIVFLDIESKNEHVNIPRDLSRGYKWSDNENWNYEIIGTNEKMKTPIDKYDNLLVIRAIKLPTNNDKVKLPIYYNYYKQNIGQVASFSEGKLLTYLVEVR